MRRHWLCRLGWHRIGWTGINEMVGGRLYRCERRGCTVEFWSRNG